MYCKNCGNAMDPAAAVCVNCGAAKNAGSSFCANCANPVNPGAAVCLSCGAPIAGTGASTDPNAKSKLTAGLLGLFLGSFGVHNFYLGYTTKAVIQLVVFLLTCWFGLGIAISVWALVESIMILTGSIKVDGKGNPLKD